MDAGNWWLIKIILGTLAAIFGLLAALFTRKNYLLDFTN